MAEPKAARTWQFSERLGAFRHLPSLFRLVWRASPTLTVASFGLRLARSALPVLMLYVGKLIIDEVVAQSRLPPPGDAFGEWFASGRLEWAGWLLAIEFGLASTDCCPSSTATSPVCCSWSMRRSSTWNSSSAATSRTGWSARGAR
jgi:hypothetical protein